MRGFDSLYLLQLMPNNPKWPTLAGRLSNPLTDTRTALEQLSMTCELSPLGKKTLERLRKRSLPPSPRGGQDRENGITS